MKLLKTIFVVYREFITHPEFRGPNFNWRVPMRLALSMWRAA
jgi:hypothetical protein